MDVFEEIYDYRKSIGFFAKETDKKEKAIIECFSKALQGEIWEKFLEYIKLVEGREELNRKEAYIKGIRDGVRIAQSLSK